MKKLVKIGVLLICFIILSLIIDVNNSFAKGDCINSIDYSVLIKHNGDIEITEVWDVSLGDENVLSRKFDEETKIDNIIIKEYDTNKAEEYNFRKIENVDEIKKYTYLFKDNVLNVFFDTSERKYISISYTLKDNLKIYLDCVETDLMIFSKKYKYDIKEFTGRVKFEDTPNNLSDIYVWLHSLNDININKVDELSQIGFSFENSKVKGNFKLKIAFPRRHITVDETKVISENRLEGVIKEEEQKSDSVIKLIKKNMEKDKVKKFFILGCSIIFGAYLIIVIVLVRHRIKLNHVMDIEKK